MKHCFLDFTRIYVLKGLLVHSLNFGSVGVCNIRMECLQNDAGSTLEDEVHGKKRRKESEWKQNKNKRLRAEGKPYIGTSGKAVSARTSGTTCR